ncbi:MAG: hypothetical protein ACRD4Y_11700, partial [Candidatus Acidiferrales bacterium]
PHACCRYLQSPIDGLIELAVKNDIQPGDVDRVEIAVLEAGWPLVCEPPERKYAPANAVDAQFSIPFGAAIALACRSAGLDQFTSGAYLSPEIRDLMGKVVMVKDSRIEKNYPSEWAANVQIRLKNGKMFENYIRFPKGDPENPLTWDELSAKFTSLAKRALPLESCEQIVDAVSKINPSTSLRALWKLTALDAPVAAHSR